MNLPTDKSILARRIRPRLKPIHGAPDLIPFVNVFFLLLVFFMIGSSFVRGIHKDYASALYWWRRAAGLQNPFGQCMLGLCYKNGYGVPVDPDAAEKWFRLSALQGNETARNELVGIPGR